MSRKIEALTEPMQVKVNKFIEELDKAGFKYTILETLRAKETQEAYYAQGREPVGKVNEKRKKAGLYLLTQAENENIITWTLDSKHLKGEAVDIAPIVNGKIPWVVVTAADAEYWLMLGKIGELCGLNWGGRWKPLSKFGIGRDAPHFET